MLVSLRKKHGCHDFGLWPAVYKKDVQELPGKGITKKSQGGHYRLRLRKRGKEQKR